MNVAADIPQDGEPPIVGRVFFINNAVDPTTGTIQLKAIFENTDEKLTPGQFVDVILTLSTLANAVVVPSHAVQNGQNGNFVFVVTKGLTVRSEEHTSELQSLMRISYAVFCLKQKKNNKYKENNKI